MILRGNLVTGVYEDEAKSQFRALRSSECFKIMLIND